MDRTSVQKKSDNLRKPPKWLGLKETVPGIEEDARVIVCYKDQEDTGIECVSYFCVTDGDYDQYEKAVWMPVTGLPWGNGKGECGG